MTIKELEAKVKCLEAEIEKLKKEPKIEYHYHYYTPFNIPFYNPLQVINNEPTYSPGHLFVTTCGQATGRGTQ